MRENKQGHSPLPASAPASPKKALGVLELQGFRAAKPAKDVDQLIKLLVPRLADDRGKALGNRPTAGGAPR